MALIWIPISKTNIQTKYILFNTVQTKVSFQIYSNELEKNKVIFLKAANQTDVCLRSNLNDHCVENEFYVLE